MQDRVAHWRNGDCQSQSFVALGQVYSDKTQASSKQNGLHLYPFHITLLNIPEEFRRSLIIERKSIAKFLPVKYVDSSSNAPHGSKMREDRMILLQETLRKVTKLIQEFALTGFQCQTKDSVQLHCHFIISNYCCDLPEAYDVLGVLDGGKTKYSCNRWYVSLEQMSIPSNASQRKLIHTKKCREVADNLLQNKNERGTKGKAINYLRTVSLSQHRSFLESFPLVNVHPLLDIYQIFTFEPLHNFHLGISRMLKEVCSQRLTSEDFRSTKLLTSDGEQRRFKDLRYSLLNGANHVLSKIEEESPARGLWIDFSVKGKGTRYNGLFKEDGLVCMLEAKDYRVLDQVFPFIGYLFDKYCGEEHAPTTNIFVQYSEILLFTNRKGMELGWTENEISQLRRKIVNFKRDSKELYQKYLQSEMGTPKFHLLDHLCDDTERMGGLQSGDASHFERSHVKVKEMYKRTSRRIVSGMEETVRNFERKLVDDLSEDQNRNDHSVVNREGARFQTYLDNVVSLVRDGPKFKFHDLRDTYLVQRRRKKSNSPSVHIPFDVNDTAYSLVRSIGDEAARMLISLFQQKYEDRNHVSKLLSMKIQKVNSVYVTGGFVPTLKDLNSENEITFHSSQRSVSQRVISAKGMFGCDRPRHDCVLIECDSAKGIRKIWIAKVLGLFRIRTAKKSENAEIQEECVFVQYFDTIQPENAAMKALGCICLRWAREEYSCEGKVNQYGKWFDLLPASSILGVVHVLTVDYPIRGIVDEAAWHEKRYFVNRFYYDPMELTYY